MSCNGMKTNQCAGVDALSASFSGRERAGWLTFHLGGIGAFSTLGNQHMDVVALSLDCTSWVLRFGDWGVLCVSHWQQLMCHCRQSA